MPAAHACSLAALVATAVALQPPPATAQSAARVDIGAHYPVGGFNQGEFRFARTARASLGALWQMSVDTRAELVACIGGYRERGISYITKVESVVARGADSVRAPALASLEQCRPPEWLGTVHTHIQLFGGRPYVTFSAPDRFVMMRWHDMWQADGVFCVLYDRRRAYCEAGPESGGEAIYGTRDDDGRLDDRRLHDGRLHDGRLDDTHTERPRAESVHATTQRRR